MTTAARADVAVACTMMVQMPAIRRDVCVYVRQNDSVRHAWNKRPPAVATR